MQQGALLQLSPFVKKNLKIAWPLAMNAFLMQSMLLIDTLLISPLGEVPVAAIGIATAIVAFLLGFQNALANGTQLVISRAYGSGRSEALSDSILSGMAINFGVAALFSLLLFSFGDELVGYITQDPELLSLTVGYLQISTLTLLFSALTQVLIACFNGLGKTKIPFKGYLLELPVNTVATYILIHQFGLGVLGAALGSLVAILVRTGFLVYCVRIDDMITLRKPGKVGHFIYLTKRHFGEIFPIAANMAMLAVGATIYQLLYSQLSLYAYVAITLIMPWIRMGTQMTTAAAHSTAILISQAIGANKLDDLRENVDTSIRIAVILSIITSGFFFALSLCLSFIYPEMEPETFQALAVIAPLYIFLPLVRGYNTVHGHALRALGKTKAVFTINFSGQWLVSLPLLAILLQFFDAPLFWAFAIMPFEECIKAIPFRHLARKTLNEFDKDKAAELNYY
ncbi:MATE family efflux transporter [Photobacterium rosenbergii]|uniref:MATE family efflux transporter n=1 Tax=Photobacterium rosenbergii TaxID=294936 RepID=UPI001C99F736|nr:polysaccharide biosynthesis C-terminal domain-containing protein [Photobacterium rosenbergii]